MERVWRRRCLLSEWEILQGTTPEPFYFWYYFRAASLFFVSSHGYVQELPRIQISLEGWVIPRQVGSRTWSSLQNLKRANISSFLFRAAIGPGVIKPGSPYVLFRRHDQGMQTFKGYSLWSHWNWEPIGYSNQHQGQQSPAIWQWVIWVHKIHPWQHP